MSNILNADQACNHRITVVKESELPLSCPMDGERVWDAHPRVYLPIEIEGEVLCPYCSTKYILERAE
jgi:uncharacterized Zn-finger protein